MPTAKTTKKKDFRGLTIFELLVILLSIGSAVYWGISTKKSLQNQLDDSVRRGRVVALKENLNAYFAVKNSFPSEDQFNDAAKRKLIFQTYLTDEGDKALNDPKNSSVLIDYSATPEGCAPDTATPCEQVSIGLYLSSGEDFTRFAVKPGQEAQLLIKDQQSTGTDGVPNSLETGD